MLLLYLFEFTVHTTISAYHMSRYYLCNDKYVHIIIYKYDYIYHIMIKHRKIHILRAVAMIM
jgi:hypothetical protein